MPNLLGVDTGGTYTDAVVVDEATGGVLAKAKAPTSHDDLATGIGAAIDAVLAEADIGPDAVDLVSLSTTLATNALVEGRGRRACLVRVGFGEGALDRGGLQAALSDTEVIVTAGGHTSHGTELAPLDLDALGAEVEALAPSVDAYAVTSQFSVRNPAHELAIRDLIRERTALPVTCSHELSSDLNGPRRALTALLNARLIALVDDLMEAAGRMLADRDIEAPVMVVRGNGSLVSADFVRDRPIETILSGPAASVIAASHLVGAADALVADMGGTTTDIAIVHDGRPDIDPHGAEVGGHQTMVEAARMHTHGLGGDSEIGLVDGPAGTELSVGPRRVEPISRVALDQPDVVAEMLRRQQGIASPGPLTGTVAIPTARRHTGELARPEREVLDALGEIPAAADLLAGSQVHQRALRRLVAGGLVRLSALTPTDAARVLGHQPNLDGQVAELAASLFARRRDRRGTPIAPSAEALARAVVAAVGRKASEAMLASALERDGLPGAAATSALARRALAGETGVARVDIGLAIPIVALGAPAGAYLATAAELLGTSCAIHEHADVANAIGAVVGRVRMSRSITVGAPRRGTYVVHTGDDPQTVHDLGAARELARAAAEAGARADAEAAGARQIAMECRWDERSATVEGRRLFVEGRLTAEATGRPRLRPRGQTPDEEGSDPTEDGV